MATITCKCRSVEIEFPVTAELFHHECCCHDCISALCYSTQRGGPQYPEDFRADCCWLPNNFRIVSGENLIGALLNYASADTTRFYCTACWTLLFGDHPLYDQRILASLIPSYKEFEGLSNIERTEPQARHFLKDRTKEQIEALPPWHGNPDHVYDGVADVLLENFPTMKAAVDTGIEMNAQILLEKIGGAFIPDDDARLTAGPPSLARQMAMQNSEAE